MSPANKGARARLTKHVVDALKNPRVHVKILEYSKPVLDAAQRWGPSIADHLGHVGDRFGQSGLERRATNVREGVADLSSGSPELATTLRPVTESLNQVELMLKVSANLPFAKRKKAHLKIDDVLDDLEAALFGATMRDRPSDPES